jgi:ABC-type multidrug transport system ATPase subunit/pSer/pThr/pTyr-binding forkhead associated (FHA) protein/prepilin signal peptidase PulO-like enzyme (type II secretory pathway)
LQPGVSYRLGRDPQSDIVLTDERVSWRHAVLQLEHDGWVLADAGSTNGTYVGTQRVDRIAISSDCVLRLGNSEDGPILRCMPRLSGQPASPPAPVQSQAPPLAPPPAQAYAPAQAPPQAPPPRQAPASPPPEFQGGAAVFLPSVDRRPTNVLSLPKTALRIGREPDNDLVVSDLGVSRHHAELRKSSDGRYRIIDLGSHNGTFVNGEQINSATLTERDIVSIGHATFRLVGDELREFIDAGDVSLAAQDLTVKVGGGKILLDHVSFPIPERCLLGIIGPSGAGKSTLLGALTGMRPADTGTVLYDNRDLYRDYAELRHRIGLVPQDSIMHTQLTARRALRYAAELRFPGDTKPKERNHRVDEVMTELGLTKHASTRAENLSGGQLKRVNVALELLTKPSLLFLDEPTSGLDPGLDKSVMEQMRDLAHDGRTVIVVTHSVANLDTCDRLLVLVPGGRVAYYGPPGDGLAFFGQPGWAEVFQAFDRYPDRDWAGEFAASGICAQYVTGPQGIRPPTPAKRPAALKHVRRGRVRQLSTLCRRYMRVIAADRGYLAFMGLLPVILGALIRFIPSPHGLGGAPGTNPDAQEVLLTLVITAIFAGAASSARELVKERAIYIRERAAGLSSGAYLSSKLIVLGVISVLQALILVTIGVTGRQMPATGAYLTHYPFIELLLGIGVLALASMMLGLLISALVSTSEKAMPFLVLLTMVQVILSGGVFALNGMMGLEQLAYLAPARWGFGATADTVNLNVINPPSGSKPDPVWNHEPKTWLTNMALQIVLGLVFTLIAWRRLAKLSPGRRR